MITAKPWRGHPQEHLAKRLPEYTLHFSVGATKQAVNVTATREIAKSESRTSEERLCSAFSSGMFEIEHKIRTVFPEPKALYLWTPEEFWWQMSPETVDDPVRMYIVRDPPNDVYFLCMAVTIAEETAKQALQNRTELEYHRQYEGDWAPEERVAQCQ